LLRGAGYAVMTVANGREALDYLRNRTAPRLLLVDMAAPDHGGWNFLHWRAQSPHVTAIPVLVLTPVRSANGEWATTLGACNCLHKPVAADVLLAEVRRCLQLTHLGRPA
jgi:CheY-like chemotaxis protein